MKPVLALLLSISLCSSFGQSNKEQVRAVLDTVLQRTQEISLYVSTLDWDSLKTVVYAQAEGAEQVADLKPAFETLLNGLGDHHGNIRKLSDYSILASLSDGTKSRHHDDREFDSETWAIVNDLGSRFEYALLPNKIGYLKLVGIGPNVDGQKEAERIRAALNELCDQQVNKWILDLRYNGGGNINVMLAGLAPLLNTKTVATILDRDQEVQCSAEIKEGDFYYCGMRVFDMHDQPAIKDSKIAVLNSRWTVSSGELVAVSFKGQANTRFFGEATGGKTTNTSWDVINNEIGLVIATGVFCDREGNAYEHYVPVDNEIEFVVESDKNKDRGILAASEWLLTDP